MDAGAFVQENKRWLLGVAVGGIAWLIGSAVVDGVYDVSAVATSTRKLGAPTSAYDGNALAAAREQSELLAAERARLQAELAFVVAPRFRMPGSDVDQYVYQVGGELKQAILNAANQRNVQISDNSIGVPPATGLDQYRAVLFGLDMLDEVQRRLFAAHDQALSEDPEAIGLHTIQQLKIEEQRAQRTMRRTPRPGEVDVRDLLDQQRLAIAFQADPATLARFLESCREPDRTLVVEAWQVLPPQRRGEPCTVKATLTAIAFREKNVEERTQ